MSPEASKVHSHSFVVRLWAEEVGAGCREWRGRLQRTADGEAVHFRTLPELLEQIRHFLEEEIPMTDPIKTAGVHHVAITVSDVRRAQAFYTELLGFQLLTEFGPRALLHNGSFILGLTPPPNPEQAIAGDRFDENRIGLDHLSFSVASRAELDAAVRLFDEKGVEHGEINELGAFGIAVLAFRDPDNIQVELTAPLGV